MNPTPSITSRRTFLQQSALAAAAVSFPAFVRGSNLNSHVQVASIGCEGMAHTDVHNIAGHAKVKYVGFCDIDSRNFARVDKISPGVPHFSDFRQMYEKLGDTFDAVNVAIPDHMHALASVLAMQRGKHVYCQKPLAHTVWECRQMSLWAKKKNVVTQMGNQGHSATEYRMAKQLLREGVLGKVKEVHSWCQFTGNERTRLLEPPSGGDEVPREVDWNLWIGGAEMRPYVTGLYHPFAWRDWQDFGGGAALGDFGCHILDPIMGGLGLTAPLSVSADNSGVNRHVWPTTETIRYVFPGNELTADKTLKVTWTDGGLKPERKLAQMPGELDLPRSGSLIIGERGNMVLAHMAGPRLYPAENFKEFTYPKVEKVPTHWHRWIDAIVAGEKTTDGFDNFAAHLAETVQLGNVATRAMKPPKPKRGSNVVKDAPVLQWDAAKLRFKNDDAANKLLTKKYRPGWEVPAA